MQSVMLSNVAFVLACSFMAWAAATAWCEARDLARQLLSRRRWRRGLRARPPYAYLDQPPVPCRGRSSRSRWRRRGAELHVSRSSSRMRSS